MDRKPKSRCAELLARKAFIRGLRRACAVADKFNLAGQDEEATKIQDALAGEVRIWERVTERIKGLSRG